MSREIKFRAWHKQGDMLYAGDDFGTTDPLDCCRYLMDGQPVTLMQFTGLSDCNGVEIYEGDVCRVDGLGKCIVEIDALYGAQFDNMNGQHVPVIDCMAESDEFFVIGNIHQNPELLQQ